MNEGNQATWAPGVQKWVEYLKTPSEDKTRPYSARYVGSLVADFHRTLLKGGVFAYPADNKNANGKLRLMYEAAPLAMIAEQAGGAAIDRQASASSTSSRPSCTSVSRSTSAAKKTWRRPWGFSEGIGGCVRAPLRGPLRFSARTPEGVLRRVRARRRFGAVPNCRG